MHDSSISLQYGIDISPQFGGKLHHDAQKTQIRHVSVTSAARDAPGTRRQSAAKKWRK
jgi:hypothetical protein